MNRRSFFSFAGACAAIAAVARVKPVEAARVPITGAGLPASTTISAAFSGHVHISTISDPCHTHSMTYPSPDTPEGRYETRYRLWRECEAAGVPLNDRPMILQQEPTAANLAALDRRILADIGIIR